MSHPDDKKSMVNEQPICRLDSIMTRNVICIDMDSTLGKAIDLCAEKRIRHLPVLDENSALVGIVTDRDLRYYVSPRMGTLSENNSDRATLNRHVHQMMARQVVSAEPDMELADAAQLMLANGVGALPIIDSGRQVIGIVTTADILRYIAQKK